MTLSATFSWGIPSSIGIKYDYNITNYSDVLPLLITLFNVMWQAPHLLIILC